MGMYTVLLVDDEEEVIQVIMKKINWEELGFSVIGYANNGVKAMELVEEYQPDIVMTDIKMPYMDGMELSKRIKTEFPACKILIFTGFDEFEYAKEAIHLEIAEYILKPVNSRELTEVFRRMKTKLDQEISEKQNIEVLQKYYTDSLPFLRTNFYTTLIEGKVGEKQIEKYLSDYQITITGNFFCCLIIHTSGTQIPENMNPLLLAASVRKQAAEYLSEKWRTKMFSYLGDTVLIAQLDTGSEISELTDDADRFCRYVRRMTGAVVTAGVGCVCGSLTELARSYEGAREAVSYRAIYGASRAINIREIAPGEKERKDTANDEKLGALFKSIRVGTEKEVEESVRRYMEQCFPQTQTLQQHHIAVMELVSALYRFSVNNEIEAEEISRDMNRLYCWLIEREPGMLNKWLVETGLSFRSQLIAARSRSRLSIVSRAEEYVFNNYTDTELSLDSICSALGVSNSYFSTIFKKEKGNSFVGFLTDYRLEKAARLLIETNEKNYLIAKKVGYADPNYFSYVFKRRFGVSPSKYKMEHTQSEG